MREKKTTLANNALYLAAILPFTAIYFLRTTNFFLKFPIIGRLHTGISAFAMVLLVTMILMNRTLTKVSAVNFMWTLPILLLISIVTGNYVYLLTIYLFIYCFSYVDRRVILTGIFFLLSFLVIFNVLSQRLGIIEDVYSWRYGVIRQSLGFRFVTYLPNYVFHLALVYVFLRERRLLWFELGAILIINQMVYHFTDTKSAYFFTILLVILIILDKIFKKVPTLISETTAIFIFLSSIAIPLLLTFFYRSSSQFFNTLNTMLTGRLFLGSEALKEYGMSLFGNRVRWVTGLSETLSISNAYNYVDSSYLNILISYGLIFLLLLVLAYVYLLKKRVIKNVYWYIVFAVIALHSSFDPQFFELLYNPFLLFIGYILNPRRDML